LDLSLQVFYLLSLQLCFRLPLIIPTTRLFYLIVDFFFNSLSRTQDLMLARQVLCHLCHVSSPFCSGCFGGTVRLAWTVILLFMLPSVAGTTGMHHHAQLLVEMGSFLLRLASNLDPPVSASLVSAIFFLLNTYYGLHIILGT
jgi:hypothetical protein